MSMVLSSDEVLSLAMEIEKSGQAYYATVAAESGDKGARELFEYLAKEETRHYELFRDLAARIGGDLEVDGESWEEASAYIKALTDGRFFLGEESAIRAARQRKTLRAALDAALGFEKDTLLFFHEILEVTRGPSRDAARNVVEEEKRHVRMLSERRRALAA